MRIQPINKPIDVTVVTGFLGSGKTTLINRLLADPALQDTAVIVNEFGEISIDHLLVEKSNEDVIEIAGGCLCCTVRGELAETLAGLVERVQTGSIGRLSRIIIETTGMADPVPVLGAIQSHPALVQALRIDRVITTVDAVAGIRALASHEEASRQLAVADIAVMTKTDIATEADRDAICLEIGSRTAATIVVAEELGNATIKLLEMVIESGSSQAAAVDQGHHHHHHKASVTTHIISHVEPVSWATIEQFLDLLRSRLDIELLRIKGIVQASENADRPIVVHGVQDRLYPPHRLDRWPEGAERKTVLVFIGTKLNGGEIDRLFGAFLNLPQPDTPDSAALVDNPLAIPGAG